MELLRNKIFDTGLIITHMNSHERPLHDPKVPVWYGVSAVGITGPYFFEYEYWQTVRVTAERYRDLLETFLMTSLQTLQGHEQTWLHQDGATDRSYSENFHGCASWVVSATTDFSLSLFALASSFTRPLRSSLFSVRIAKKQSVRQPSNGLEWAANKNLKRNRQRYGAYQGVSAMYPT
jgi:hypothetical protein